MQDFELICNNAMRYNQKRSRIHKAARTMLRAGMKQLQAAERLGREAIIALHPEGRDAALRDEANHPAPEPVKQRRTTVGIAIGSIKGPTATCGPDVMKTTTLQTVLPSGIKSGTQGTCQAPAHAKNEALANSSWQAAHDFEPLVCPTADLFGPPFPRLSREGRGSTGCQE